MTKWENIYEGTKMYIQGGTESSWHDQERYNPEPSIAIIPYIHLLVQHT